MALPAIEFNKHPMPTINSVAVLGFEFIDRTVPDSLTNIRLPPRWPVLERARLANHNSRV